MVTKLSIYLTVIDFMMKYIILLQMRNQIIVKGEEFLKDILKDKLKENKVEEIEKMIKNFKPIEIEVK